MNKDREPGNQRGAVLVESAITLMIFLVILFAIWEGGRLLNTQETLTCAAREGVRLAVTPLTQTDNLPTRGQVKNEVNRFLQAAGISGATIAINGSTGGNDSDVIGSSDLPPIVIAGSGEYTAVAVIVRYKLITTSIFSSLAVNLTGTALMRNETSP